MRCHSMECVTMRRKGTHLLALDVPGLAERRPSLVHGDFVFVKLVAANADANKVHRVCSSSWNNCFFSQKSAVACFNVETPINLKFIIFSLPNHVLLLN